MMRLRRLAGLVVLVQLAARVANAGGEIFDLDAALRRGLAEHPDIVSTQAEVAAAEARLREASLLFRSNPRVEAAGGPRDGDRTTTDYSVELSQEVEIGGQRSARIAAAKASLDAGHARLAWRRVEIAASIRAAFGRALAARRLFEVALEGEKTAQQALDAAETRFRAGDISRIEINAARVERGRSAQERGRAEQRAAAATAELQLLLALPPDATLVVEGELPTAATQPPEALPALIGEALQARGDLRSARAELTAARAESELAAREWLPSPRVGASFGHEEDADIVQGVLGVELPAFHRNQAGRGAAIAAVVQAEQALQAKERHAEQETRLAHLRVRIAEQVASAYATEVVSAMRENLDLGNRAYQASQIDVTQFLLIRGASLEAQRSHIDALEELGAARAELRRAVGRE